MKSIRTAFAPTQPKNRASARGTIALAALLIAWLAPATPSLAGTYRVDSCRIPTGASAGSPAPLEVAEGGAEAPGEWNRISSGNVQYANTCASSGSLMAALEANVPHSDADVMTWQFTAPPGESIAKATLWRAGDADGGDGYLFWLAAQPDLSYSELVSSGKAFGSCAYTGGCEGKGNYLSPLTSDNRYEIPGEYLGSSHLYINVACSLEECASDEGDEEGYAVVYYLYAAEMELEETAAPTVSDVSGELATGGPLSDEAGLEFHAEDGGSGVYQAIVEVDGEQLQRFVIDEAEGRCAPIGEVGAGTPLTFLRPQPCPKTVTGHVSLETTSLSDGDHSLRVLVTNAAGNSTPVLEREIDVDNDDEPGQAGGNGTQEGAGQEGSGQAGGSAQPPAQDEGQQPAQALADPVTDDTLTAPLPSTTHDLPATAASTANGDHASVRAKLAARWVIARKTRRGRDSSLLTVAYGRGASIAGTLTTAGGATIAHAVIDASALPAYGGARSTPMSKVRTGRHGRFTLKLPKSVSSRTIELSYASSRGGKPVASAALRLQVSAGVRLRVSPKRTAAGETIRLSGTVLGAPIPHGGKQVVLEARSAGTPWLQFKVLHTSARGNFAATHRFRLPGPIRYSFRAVCPAEADFPFQAGASRAVSVWER